METEDASALRSIRSVLLRVLCGGHFPFLHTDNLLSVRRFRRVVAQMKM